MRDARRDTKVLLLFTTKGHGFFTTKAHEGVGTKGHEGSFAFYHKGTRRKLFVCLCEPKRSELFVRLRG